MVRAAGFKMKKVKTRTITVALKIIPVEYVMGFDKFDKVESKKNLYLWEKLKHPALVDVY